VKQTFNKSERLHSKKLIIKLFEEGKSFFSYPFKVIYLEQKSDNPGTVQLLVSVSRRNFKKATDRNKVKRLIRESYRKNKPQLYDQRSASDKQLLIGLIYTASTIISYAEIEKKIILILQRLIKQDEQTAG